MLNKIVTAGLNWVLATLVLPVMTYIYDIWKLRRENKELKENIKRLKDAKTKADIDEAIDKLP